MSAKTASYQITTVDVICPTCGECVPETTTGSLYWSVNEMTPGSVHKCQNGHEVKLPNVRQPKIKAVLA